MDEIFGGSDNSNTTNSTSNDDMLDAALIDLVPIPPETKTEVNPDDPFSIFFQLHPSLSFTFTVFPYGVGEGIGVAVAAAPCTLADGVGVGVSLEPPGVGVGVGVPPKSSDGG